MAVLLMLFTFFVFAMVDFLMHHDKKTTPTQPVKPEQTIMETYQLPKAA